jgi:hypothetical protein
VDPRAGLDNMEKRKFLTLTRIELRYLGRPARSQSLPPLLLPSISFEIHHDHHPTFYIPTLYSLDTERIVKI